jgi:single-strand DNA-binding protein
MQSINRVVLTGNLTRDPDLRNTTGGLAICSLRLACNTRRKNNDTGQWEDKPNYFDVTVFGAQGENCAKFLSKGRPVAVDGRLDWREWESEGGKRQAVQIVAESVQFLGDAQSNGGGGQTRSAPASEPAQVAADTSDFVGDPDPNADEDIPF